MDICLFLFLVGIIFMFDGKKYYFWIFIQNFNFKPYGRGARSDISVFEMNIKGSYIFFPLCQKRIGE